MGIKGKAENRMKSFVSWSSGKESALALYRMQKKTQVSCLLNMVSEDKKRARSHGIEVELIKTQSEALGLPLILKTSTWANYEAVFKKTLIELKSKGINSGIFGDIDMPAYKNWVKKVCAYAGIKAYLPLWQEPRKVLMDEFIRLGFKAIVICVKTEYLNKNWLGRVIDKEFIKKLKTLRNVDLCGENGEYHTFVYDGPIFKKPVEFVKNKIINKKEHLFLELNKKN
ncbi:MAG: diphthine--ammonia ligase [Candidatus Omnitrophota bacterium]